MQQAILWLPTGVAVAGVWLLGLRSLWVVALVVVCLRMRLGYPLDAAVVRAFGSTAEALVGVLVLRGLKVEAAFARLRDVLALFAAAAVAPLPSILCGMLALALPGQGSTLSLTSGWDGWWRMNALGMIVVVPLVATWSNADLKRAHTRSLAEASAIAIALTAVVWSVMTQIEPGPMGLILLYLALPIALLAAVRFGPRGAATAGISAAVAIVIGTAQGVGPFLSVPIEERHAALQLFELSLLAIPLIVGALIAERETAYLGRLRSETSREAFQAILPDITYRVRADGTIADVYVPRGFEHSVRRETLLDQPLDAWVPREHGPAMLAAIRATLAGELTQPHEYGVIVDGQLRVREVRHVRLGADEVLSLVRDITERDRAQKQLAFQAEVLEQVATGRMSRDVLRALVQGIERLTDGGLGSVLLLEGRRLYTEQSPSLPDSYNRAIDGVEIGPSVGSCGTAVYSGRTVIVHDIASDPLWKDFAAVALAHDLRACWSVPIRDTAGRPIGSFAVYYREPRAPTVAELALVERAGALAGIAIERERREDLLAAINRNVNEGLFRSTPDHGLVYVNSALVRMFGYPSAEAMLARAPSELYADPARREEVKRGIADHGQIADFEILFKRVDGSTFWGLASVTGVAGPDGKPQYFDGAITDITARKQLEEQLRQAQKMEAVGRLAGGVAHDFNNLLTAITGYADSLLDVLPADGAAHHDAREIANAADRAATLTRQLLAYSRQQTLTPKVHDLALIVTQLGDMLRRLIGANIRLSMTNAQSSAFVLVDRGQIEQVLVNLVLNARDAMPNGGVATISIATVEVDAAALQGEIGVDPGTFVRLTVEDTGIGMDAPTRQRAFDPFFTTKEQGKGTGLGLSTVDGIVRQSGGFVGLHSVLNDGTTVSVYLPCHAAPAASAPASAVVSVIPAAPVPPPVAPSSGTILVVEDEPLVRDIVTRTLREAGFAVLEAHNGEHAVELARQAVATIDLVVTDIVMPRMGGIELAKRLRRTNPGMRVLLVSGYSPETLQLHDGPELETGFLQKPFARSVLLERVRVLLAATPKSARLPASP